MIRVRNLQKVIGPSTVLSIEKLDVEAGEIAAVLGSPGSGKTTLTACG